MSIGKYYGSKQRFHKLFCKTILDYVKDKEYNCIIEPFCGTSVTLAEFRKHVSCPIYGSDQLTCLIVTLKAFQAENFVCKSSITAEEFERLRTADDDPMKVIVHSGASFYGCFMRDKWNPYHNANLAKIAKRLAKKPPQMKGIEFKCCDYKDWSDTIGSLLILDPPYVHGRDNNTWPKNWKGFDNVEFWKWAEHMSENNIVIVAEYQAPENWECIWSKTFISNSRWGKSRTKTEKLFVYKRPMKQDVLESS